MPFDSVCADVCRLIFGFMAKETCEQLLSSMEPGVFIIRFSDSRPGLFAVAYVSTTQLPKSTNYEVKHYLVNNQGMMSIGLVFIICRHWIKQVTARLFAEPRNSVSHLEN